MLSPTFSLEALQKHILHLLAELKEGARFIMGVADLVPPDADLQRLRMISNLVFEYGKYS